ncbi:MAG: phosphatidylserine decarboxylase [Deltaproteobacteria bacterium]|nr:phosphatidylserine decarboxylase [Deltaproteobacteria bacterium]
MRQLVEHQYIDRETGAVCTERLYADWMLNTLYLSAWEKVPALYRLLTSARFSRVLGLFCYDSPLGARLSGNRRFLRSCRVAIEECLDPPDRLDTARKIFERRIRYWKCRPLPDNPRAVVSPADARVLVGSFRDTSSLFLKEKFFGAGELLDSNKPIWVNTFVKGDFAIFRLTPDKYHYNHVPVAGLVCDTYEIPGEYHSCNPGVVEAISSSYAKNKRVVTLLNTDVEGGSGVGFVAMIEIVALMIGDIVQCYSEECYEAPCAAARGRFLKCGQPKSLYRPGSSTTVLLFQPDRVRFADDLVANQHRAGVCSRFSQGLGRSLVETDVKVRSLLAWPVSGSSRPALRPWYAQIARVLPQPIAARGL